MKQTLNTFLIFFFHFLRCFSLAKSPGGQILFYFIYEEGYDMCRNLFFYGLQLNVYSENFLGLRWRGKVKQRHLVSTAVVTTYLVFSCCNTIEIKLEGQGSHYVLGCCYIMLSDNRTTKRLVQIQC